MTCSIYEKSIELMNNFFLIQPYQNDGSDKIFKTLREIIKFNSGYIFYLNSDEINLEYSYRPLKKIADKKKYKITDKLKEKLNNENIEKEIAELLDINKPIIVEKLSIKNTVFGIIIITSDKKDENYHNYKKIFKTCASIISSLIKDIEITKILNMQVEALEEGYSHIRKENKKILEAEKVKNNFLANISHELRTPLNSIICFSELLTEEFIGRLNDKQKEYVEDIKVSGLHLLSMINEILDISKLEADAMKLNYRRFKLDTTVNEVCNLLMPLSLKKNIKIIKNIYDLEIYADYQKILQILFNLLNNAIKFTPDNGQITIEIGKTDKEIILKVIDTGIGIDKKYHKKIFKKFEQIENNVATSSTGLGLTITKELVKLHNGNISVESNPGKGSIFIVKIPNKI